MALRQKIAGSIRHKMVLVVLAAVCSALMVAGVALALHEADSYQRQVYEDLNTQAEILGRASASALAFDDESAVRENLQLLKSRPGILAAAVYGPRGKRVADYRSGAPNPRAIPALPEGDGMRVEGEHLAIFKRVVEKGEIVGTVYLDGHYALRARLRDYLGILASVMALSLLVAALLAWWLQRALTQPILAVTAAAQQVMERKDFSLRVARSTDDEVGLLVDAFNSMLAELGRREQALVASQQSLEQEVAERRRVDQDLRDLNATLEHRITERTAQLQSANKELESFSYSVSHDLRAPLRGVVGFADALLEDHADELGEEARRKLRVVHGEGLRMGRLIDDLLTFSRLGRKALQTSPLDMEALARASWASVLGPAEGAGVGAVQFELDRLPEAQGDAALLTQVWVNLLSNAKKFSARRATPQITVSAITDGAEHIYFVRDNGAGFNPKYQDKLFGVFQRLHDANDYPGTGVGLALVHRIVLRHGGRVWAEGQADRGATFYFSLPKERHDEPV